MVFVTGGDSIATRATLSGFTVRARRPVAPVAPNGAGDSAPHYGNATGLAIRSPVNRTAHTYSDTSSWPTSPVIGRSTTARTR